MNAENKPVIIGRNDGCPICDDLGYICDDCLFDYFDDEQEEEQVISDLSVAKGVEST